MVVGVCMGRARILGGSCTCTCSMNKRHSNYSTLPPKRSKQLIKGNDSIYRKYVKRHLYISASSKAARTYFFLIERNSCAHRFNSKDCTELAKIYWRISLLRVDLLKSEYFWYFKMHARDRF